MKATINAFYGAKVYGDNGREITTLPHRTEVKVVEPFGGPAMRKGEYAKVVYVDTEGWVQAGQLVVEAPHEQFRRTLLAEAKDMHDFLSENPGRDDADTLRFKAAESALDSASAEMSMRQFAAMVEMCGGAIALRKWLEAQI